MNYKIFVCLVALIALPIAGDSIVEAQRKSVTAEANGRDLSAHDAALSDVNAKASEWSVKVGESDQALAALQAAQAAFDTAVAAEAQARTDYESAQAAYNQAYTDVPKEDSLTP